MKNKIAEKTFKNGFKIIVKEDHRSPIAIFQIVYKVGSSYEHYGITGISHALEHMMFRGTRHYSSNEFIEKIAEFGGQQNARTGHDYTAYYQVLGSANLEYCFKFEADRMRHLKLDKGAFAKEIQIIMEERRMCIDDVPQQLTLEHFHAVAYLSNPYHHPIIGWMHDLTQMTADDLRKWYQTWYAPNNAVGIIIGDVKTKSMYQLAQKYFANLKPSSLPTIKPQIEVAPLGMRSLVVKTPAKIPWFVIGFNVPVVNTATEKWYPYALLLLCEILAGSHIARMPKKIIKEKQMANDIDYHYSPFSRFDNILSFSATPSAHHHLDQVRDEILREIENLQIDSPASQELKRVKTQFLANRIYQEDSIAYQAYEIASIEAVGLSWRDLDKAYKEIAAITPKQILEVASRYLTRDRMIFGELQPVKF